MTYYGTGCIFHYDDEFPQGSGKGFKEADKPNFTGSYYSYTKVNRAEQQSGRDACSCRQARRRCGASSRFTTIPPVLTDSRAGHDRWLLRMLLQAMVESLLKEFPNVLTLRVRMPIVADLTYERNFITKIIKYDKVCAGSIQLHMFCGGTMHASHKMIAASRAGKL
jgi:hypothetical protein